MCDTPVFTITDTPWTAERLIHTLQGYPPEAAVLIYCDDCDGYSDCAVATLSQREDGQALVLSAAPIRNRFRHCSHPHCPRNNAVPCTPPPHGDFEELLEKADVDIDALFDAVPGQYVCPAVIARVQNP